MATFEDLDDIANELAISSGNNNGKTGWLKINPGDNKIRMVSEFAVLAKHFSGKGSRPQTCVGKGGGCPRCKLYDEFEKELDAQPKVIGPDGKAEKRPPNPHKATPKFLFWCIDRADGQLKIAEVGFNIIDKIRNYTINEEYGMNPDTKLPEYDLTIQKNVANGGKSPSDTSYEVLAARKNTDLTPEEIDAISKLTPIDKVVDSIKKKAIKDYEEQGILVDTAIRDDQGNKIF